MLLADTAQHEAERNGLWTVFLIDDFRDTEVRLLIVHARGVYHFISRFFISGETDLRCGALGVEVLHLAQERDRRFDRLPSKCKCLQGGRHWQGTEPASDACASPCGGDQVMRQVHDGTGGSLDENGCMISHCNKLSVAGHEVHGVEQSGSVLHVRWMPFHPLGNDSSLLHFARRTEFPPERSKGHFEKRILRASNRVQLQLAPVALEAFEVPWSQMLRSHPWLEIHYTATEGAGPSV